MAKDIDTIEKNDTAFSKKQIVMSAKFSANRDILSVLLEDDKVYTESEVSSVLNSFLTRKV